MSGPRLPVGTRLSVIAPDSQELHRARIVRLVSDDKDMHDRMPGPYYRDRERRASSGAASPRGGPARTSGGEPEGHGPIAPRQRHAARRSGPIVHVARGPSSSRCGLASRSRIEARVARLLLPRLRHAADLLSPRILGTTADLLLESLLPRV